MTGLPIPSNQGSFKGGFSPDGKPLNLSVHRSQGVDPVSKIGREQDSMKPLGIIIRVLKTQIGTVKVPKVFEGKEGRILTIGLSR